MNKPLIWAHRGASGYMPENTLLSFEKAIEQKADGIELDIQLTKDQQIVVCHDEFIDRTSNGTGFLKDYTLEELRKLNFNKTHPEVEWADIPTMEEVFQLIKPTNLTINIELKTGVFDYEGIEEKIIAMTHAYEMEDRVIYSSFNHRSILKIKELNPSARTAFLYEDGPLDIVDYAKKYGVDALHPWFVNLRYPDLMKECIENDIEVNVWTVNEEQYIRMCMEYGVHAIITNTPDYARSVIENTLYSPEFSELLNIKVRPWLKNTVHAHDIFSQDGTRLRLYSAINPNAKASILMVHGFCEFFGKHHMNAYTLYEGGYSIYFIELRGHGDSQHNPFYADQRVGIHHFSDYVEDVDAAVQYIKEHTNDKLYLFAHSMGGLVSTLYLEEHHDVFECALLTAPMLKINYGPFPDAAVGLLKVYSDVVRNDDDYAPGQGPFNFKKNLEHSSAMDADRYNYQFSMRLENVKYQTYGSTWHWVKESRSAAKKARENVEQFKTLTMITQASADTMVDNEGQDEFVANTIYAIKKVYEGSRHEIFNATKEIREQWYKDVLTFYHACDD